MVWNEGKNTREVQVRCGQCIGCRIDKRDGWAVRCYLESKMHAENCFATLTYDEEHYPMHGSLVYRDAQLFLKRTRKALGPFRFFIVGEYGERLQRPHWHILFFGMRPFDCRKSNWMRSKSDVYTSEVLGQCWGKGQHSIGEVTFQSARYCATYTTKVITGQLAEQHYRRVDERTGEEVMVRPEMARMSLKPGIASGWFDKYYPEIYTHNAVIVNGSKKRIPEYFDDRLAIAAPELYDEIVEKRTKEVKHEEQTRQRLAVREACAIARSKFLEESRV